MPLLLTPVSTPREEMPNPQLWKRAWCLAGLQALLPPHKKPKAEARRILSSYFIPLVLVSAGIKLIFTRSWEGTQPGQLTQSQHRLVTATTVPGDRVDQSSSDKCFQYCKAQRRLTCKATHVMEHPGLTLTMLFCTV